MSHSIHELHGIIDNLERRLAKFNSEGATEKQKQSMESQFKLIEQLTGIYNTYRRLTLWDVWTQAQREIDNITDKDKEIDGVILRFPLKENPKNFAYINFDL